MKIHELKTWPEEFQATLIGIKSFEARKNDRNFEVGDIIVLREWSPRTSRYTGRKFTVVVMYILQDKFELPDNMVIMSICPKPYKHLGQKNTLTLSRTNGRYPK